MKITPHIFNAYLKCQTKCWLLATGEHPAGNAYAKWVRAQSDAYRLAEATRLITLTPSTEILLSHSNLYISSEGMKAAKWRLAINIQIALNEKNHLARNGSQNESYPLLEMCNIEGLPSSVADQKLLRVIEPDFHAIERIPPEGRGKLTKFIPIRFAFSNKLDSDERMMLALDALLLTEILGRTVGFGKIIHGYKHTTVKVNTLGMASKVRNHVTEMVALLSSHLPPDLSLNRHCVECEFQDYCRKIAIERDDVSLLSNMSGKEREKFRDKGIFTVTQLSYTFRPRRHAKNRSGKREKHHHSLKALAIREKKVHIVGSPELKIKGTPVYFDVEGLPDSGLYYLIGVRINNGHSTIQHSLWASEIEDEQRIWNNFLSILTSVGDPVLIHYGSYETTFLTRMQNRYGIPPEHSTLAGVFEHAVNIVSIMFSKIYFPTYSNSLKDIALHLNFNWSEMDSSGLTSIVWRHQWEEKHTVDLKQKLTIYNAEDCEALEKVVNALYEFEKKKSNSIIAGEKDNFVDITMLRREKFCSFGMNNFALPALDLINKAGYWDYQRNRIFLRTDKRVKSVVQNYSKRRQKTVRFNQTIELMDRPSCCPKCGHTKIERHNWVEKTVHDLKFGKSGIKRWIVRYRFNRYLCCSCRFTFYTPNRPWAKSKYGTDLRSYIIFNLIELRLPQTSIISSLNKLFGMNVPNGIVAGQKFLASKFYEQTYQNIIRHLVAGKFIHADETKISIDLKDAYVWVFASHDAVAYIFTDSREGGMVQELLRNFKGVLISDFYSAYDSIDCPQQKCLVHLIRDLNDDIFKQPFNFELISMVSEFSEMLKSIVETVDRFGLKARFLTKHKKHVATFYRSILGRKFMTEIAIKYQKRFEKNANKLFTFLDYDNVPWNNNNAEHAIKPFAKLRNIIGGTSTPKGIREYLVLLSIEETCKYRGVSFLDFLRSGELDIDKFSADSYRINSQIM